MTALFRIGIVLFLSIVFGGATAATDFDLRDALHPQQIDVVRINLNPGGAGLGFETEIEGSDPRLSALIEVIRQADTRGGHKCPNAGAIRFRMRDGSTIGVGLLPSHTRGFYEFRLYDRETLIAAYRVNRSALLAALADLGVPTDDPAFRE